MHGERHQPPRLARHPRAPPAAHRLAAPPAGAGHGDGVRTRAHRPGGDSRDHHDLRRVSCGRTAGVHDAPHGAAHPARFARRHHRLLADASDSAGSDGREQSDLGGAAPGRAAGRRRLGAVHGARASAGRCAERRLGAGARAGDDRRPVCDGCGHHRDDSAVRRRRGGGRVHHRHVDQRSEAVRPFTGGAHPGWSGLAACQVGVGDGARDGRGSPVPGTHAGASSPRRRR